MGSQWADLVSCYRQALTLGDELLQRWQAGHSEPDLEGVEKLITRREAVLTEAQSMLADRVPTEPPEELAQLVQQQQALERQATAVLKELRHDSNKRAAARHSLEGVKRILDPGTQSRWLDRKR